MIFSKCKLTKKVPKEESIPKLELEGLNLLTVLIEQIRNAFLYVKISNILWCDSTNALHWCAAGSNPVTYVHNRLAKITTRAAGWEINHISGEDNPADWLTKPVKAKKLMSYSLWWEGPKWPKNPQNWDRENPYSLNGGGMEPDFTQGTMSAMLGNIAPSMAQDKLPSFWRMND